MISRNRSSSSSGGNIEEACLSCCDSCFNSIELHAALAAALFGEQHVHLR
jgi:hypothetical protein